ncbi:MAG: dienelactone hydrolase family protein [Novosphingobium sp.]
MKLAEFQQIGCEHEGVPLAGFAARPPSGDRLPTVLAFPGAAGGALRMRMTVSKLAELGYLAAAVSMYDAREDASDEKAAGRLFMELIKAPDRLRSRVRTWFDAVAALPGADPDRMAAIGYCFGGKCVLELARGGADVKVTIAYHGLLTTDAPARPGDIKGEVAAYCAGRDPFVPVADIDALRGELTEAGVPHQITLFSDARHAFTDPEADSHGRAGIAFDALAERISWAGTVELLDMKLRDRS